MKEGKKTINTKHFLLENLNYITIAKLHEKQEGTEWDLSFLDLRSWY